MGEALVVRYMRYRGEFPARTFLDSKCTTEERARFLALAKQLASQGSLPGRSFGHFLKGEFSKIYELKPFGKRFFGFFIDTSFYVVSAAPKRNPKEQVADYERAMKLRADFLQGLEKAKQTKAK